MKQVECSLASDSLHHQLQKKKNKKKKTTSSDRCFGSLVVFDLRIWRNENGMDVTDCYCGNQLSPLLPTRRCSSSTPLLTASICLLAECRWDSSDDRHDSHPKRTTQASTFHGWHERFILRGRGGVGNIFLALTAVGNSETVRHFQIVNVRRQSEFRGAKLNHSYPKRAVLLIRTPRKKSPWKPTQNISHNCHTIIFTHRFYAFFSLGPTDLNTGRASERASP